MKYNVQYKTDECETAPKEIEVSVDNYDELVSWLNLFQQFNKAKEVEFSLVSEDLEV
jgi:hypothetical protein|tara:strand:+ start:367 stop:537 length:171 start_codon:yes stop_codon:yes gene_type:complete